MNEKTPQDIARDLGVPLIAPLPRNVRPFDPNPVVAVCGECGRKIYRNEGYSCPNGMCPIQATAYWP